MPFAVIEGGVFGSKVVGYGIARRKPAAHFADARRLPLHSAATPLAQFPQAKKF